MAHHVGFGFYRFGIFFIAIFGFYTKSNWKIFIIISVILALFVGILTTITWNKVLKPYQKDRIVAFVNPEETTSDIGFNVNQSKIAIGSGRIFGKGFGNGTQSKRNFLPEFRTDFIFASYASNILIYLFLFQYPFLCKLVDSRH